MGGLVGVLMGVMVGVLDGLGELLGVSLGLTVGLAIGARVGTSIGIEIGAMVGLPVGPEVGSDVVKIGSSMSTVMVISGLFVACAKFSTISATNASSCSVLEDTSTRPSLISSISVKSPVNITLQA